MIVIPSAAQSARAEAVVVHRWGVVFEIDGTWGYWGGMAPLVAPGTSNICVEARGVTFHPVPNGMKVDVTATDADGSATGVVLRTRAIADTAINRDLLGRIRALKYHHRPMHLVEFDLDTDYALLAITRMWTGTVDKITAPKDGRGSTGLVIRGEDRRIEMVRGNTHMAGPSSQKTTYPGDKGFDHLDRGDEIAAWAQGVTQRRAQS